MTSVVVALIKTFLRHASGSTVCFLFVSDCQAQMQDQFIGGEGSQKTADIYYYTKHLKDMTV